MSLEILREKRTNGNAHHQIIAVACSIEHAKQIMELYEEVNLRAAYVTSDRPEESEKSIIEFKKGQLDVLVNVNMLGEGFDHPNISIAAIFRPFRTLPPYAQFIGRALRRIQEENTLDDIDNVAHVIYHKELDLDELWSYYTGQKEKADRKKEILREYDEIIYDKNFDVGIVKIEGEIVKTTKEFLNDGIGNQYKLALNEVIRERDEELNSIADKMRKSGVDQKDIEDFIHQQRRKLETELDKKANKLREELIREELHEIHKEDIANQVEYLFEKAKVDPKGNELPSTSNNPIFTSAKTNDAYVMMYINFNLKQKLKRGIDEWETYDFEEARKLLPGVIEKLNKKLNER